jgi:NAD+ kinase
MKTLGIVARPDLAEAGPALRELVAWLSGHDVRVLLEEHTATLLGNEAVRECVRPGRELGAESEALVVLGGDGTLLAASQLLGDHSIPVLGVNFGSLGFLTEIALPELYPALLALLEDRFSCEERRLLRARLERPGAEPVVRDVLNDVVVTNAAAARIIELDVALDGSFVSAFRADGLIVSSPTGSTAYNLAAGGPILHPSLPAIVLTPICPHMLSNRPLVVGDLSRVEVRLRNARDVEVHVSFDGQRGPALSPGDVVVVTRSTRTLRLVRAPARDYFEVLRTKLKWGESTARRRPDHS